MQLVPLINFFGETSWFALFKIARICSATPADFAGTFNFFVDGLDARDTVI